jgi:anti-sigma regulatory factor (Ser/Thr protein kinase)
MGEGSVVTWPDVVADPPGMSASWPLTTTLPLGALPGATPCARLHARAVLTEWGLGDLADAAELIVSELVTNAVRASTGKDGKPRYDGASMPVVVLRMASDRIRLLIEVWDPGRAGHRAPWSRGRGRAGPDARRGDVRPLALADRPGLARQGRLGRAPQRLTFTPNSRTRARWV